MHAAAHDWVFQSFHNWRQDKENLDVLDIGSLNINGSARDVIQQFSKTYHGIDMQSGPGVDEVIDASVYIKPNSFDVIVCCEVFEHTPVWQNIIYNASESLREGGLFIATMGGETRPPHSGVHGNAPYEWEHYANIGEWQLRQTLKKHFGKFETSFIKPMVHADLRCWAIK